MGNIIKWGFIGLVLFIIITGLIVPFSCFAFANQYSQISCTAEDNVGVIFDMYSNVYTFILLLLGFFLGSLIGRLFDLLEIEKGKIYNIKSKELKKRKFKWMWEH